MNLTEISAHEFEKFESRSRYGNFFQSAERAAFRQNFGWNTYLIGLKDNDSLLAVAELNIQNGWGLVQLGPILDYKNEKLFRIFIDKLKKYCIAKKVISLEVYPPVVLNLRDHTGKITESFNREPLKKILKSAGFTYFGETTEISRVVNRWMVVKDLKNIHDKEELRASYKPSVRNKLRRFESDLRVEKLTEKSALPSLLLALNDSDRKNGVISRKLDYFEKIFDAFGKKAEFYVIKKKDDGAIVAGGLITFHKNEVVDFTSGVVQKYKKYNGTTFFLDYAMQRAVEEKIPRFNFYGIEGTFDNNPLLEFKSGFRGVFVEEYLGGFEIIFDKKRYRLNRIKKSILNFLRSIKYKLKS